MSKELFMQRALDLASLAQESASPNPMVGCVIVHDGKVVSEAYHLRAGEPHAEVNAINQLSDKNILPECEIYVSLEPCSHFGKTPPCADLLLFHKVKKVSVCNLDPNPLVAGKGIEKLKNAGVEVEIGILENEGKYLNRRFFKAIQQKIPYIVLKWAETSDGFVASNNKKPLKISNTTSDILVHKWRSEEDSILVGSNTIKIDNPQLNSRKWPEGRNPTRVVLDRSNALKNNFNVFDNTQKTILYNCHTDLVSGNVEFVKMPNQEDFLLEVLRNLYARGINSVFVEGGPRIISAFIKSKFYDEIRIIKSDFAIGSGLDAPKVPSGIKLFKTQSIINDQHFYYIKDFI
jgi:diaminohydroxyphosphoribosylaminopyrimidine deaminase/5-amino-6-(5-phosphoribosylamino)uracil reductase